MARDALGPMVVEVRAHLLANGGDLAHAPVRGGERGPNDAPPYVLIRHQRQLRARRGLRRLDAALECLVYGRSPLEASRLMGLVSDAIHGGDGTPRTTSGTGIYSSDEETGSQANRDRDTDWPYELAVFRAVISPV